MNDNIEVVEKMTTLAREWENQNDKKAIFLRCYSIMTANMLEAINEKRFIDNAWVERLLHRFADYYFDALACFDCGENVPQVWKNVHEAAAQKNLHVIQHLLLGVNAHINYDLVLTLYDLLIPEWDTISKEGLKARYHDHCLVNTIIGETIDKVQDEVVEQYSPMMAFIDKVMGRIDENLVVTLISNWREEVWENALGLLHSSTENQKKRHLRQLEKEVLGHAQWLEINIGLS